MIFPVKADRESSMLACRMMRVGCHEVYLTVLAMPFCCQNHLRFKTSFITTFLNRLLRKSFSLKINVLGPSAHPRLENGFVQSTQVNEHIVFSSPGGHLGFSFVIIPCFSLKMTNYCLILTLITSTMNAVGSSFSHPLNSIVLAPQKPPDSATLIKDKALIRLF